MDDRISNFLRNWIDTNVSHEPSDESATMQYRFLTDPVGAGLKLEDVNVQWPAAEEKFGKLLPGSYSKRSGCE